MPTVFAVGDKVIGNAALTTFAALGSFAMLLLADFGGPMAERLQAQAALAVAGGVFACLGTLVSRTVWLAAIAMAVVSFGVIFSGVVSSVLAGTTTALLLAFILPVSLAGSAWSVPGRLAGWGMAGGAALAAVALLWPAPARDPLRGAVTIACRALAAQLRSQVTHMLGGVGKQSALDRDHAAGRASQAVSALQRAFLATPYRPTGLSTAARTVVRLVDEVSWLDAIVAQVGRRGEDAAVNRAACAVKVAAAAVLERGADLLDVRGGDGGHLHAALADMSGAVTRMERSAMANLPVRQALPATGAAAEERASEFITSLDPAFRAQELSFAAWLIARNIHLTAAAERRSWWARLLGRQPEGITGALSAAQERATAYAEPHSLWLHNSVRGAVGLGLAVLAAKLTGVQHSFWVVLGALSVLRSSALNTEQDVARALIGTIAGFVIAAGLLVAIGTNATLLWFLLPLAVFLAGVAPTVISFAGGQAAFTVTAVILFNIIQPAGWRIGLLRVEDIALGCVVSLAVGLLFWPRGAGPALRQTLADAYTDSAVYLADAVNFGMRRYDASLPAAVTPTGDATRAAAAARRLDDAFRTYLAERGAKPIPLASVTRLVNGVAKIRLGADAVLDLWQRSDEAAGDRPIARSEILETTQRVRSWYEDFAGSLTNRRELREPLARDEAANGRLIEALRRDLGGEDGKATATAVRIIWTGDHLDAVRRLQTTIIPPARFAAARRTRSRFAGFLPRRLSRISSG